MFLTPIMDYAYYGDCVNLTDELEKSTLKQIDTQDLQGTTALQLAAKVSSEATKILLEFGANPNISDNEGLTPLMQAARYGTIDAIKELVKCKKLKVNTKDKHGMTALMFAAQIGKRDIVRALLDAKADKKQKNKVGKTAYSLAKTYEQRNVTELLKIEKKHSCLGMC